MEVVLDVVRRYDIDGVHIDDYFYPYRETDRRGRNLPFPDDASWQLYRLSGGGLERNDWRRDNVDRFVERLYREVKEEKPWVKVGISPFGIWRPGNPPQIRGLDAYAEIYADARKWLRNGWIDYFTPQLYWTIDQKAQSYPVLLDWWVGENVYGRHIWAGNFTSRIAVRSQSGPEFWTVDEVLRQIQLTRAQPGAGGNVHFSARVLMRNPKGLVERLQTEAYAAPALVPASPWLGDTPPGEPAVVVQDDPETGGVTLTMKPTGEIQPQWWTVQARYADGWTTEILPAWRGAHILVRNGRAPRCGGGVRGGIDWATRDPRQW